MSPDANQVRAHAVSRRPSPGASLRGQDRRRWWLVGVPSSCVPWRYWANAAESEVESDETLRRKPICGAKLALAAVNGHGQRPDPGSRYRMKMDPLGQAPSEPN